MSTTTPDSPPAHTLDTIRSLVANMPAGMELADAVRHMLDVADRQRAMLERLEYAASDDTCPACEHFDPEGGPSDAAMYVGHTPTCALDALLRETR